MSTKIYDAFRLPKGNDILKTLEKVREIFTEAVSKDETLLYCIHAVTTMEASIEFEKDPKNFIAKEVIEGNKNNNIDSFWIERYLEKISMSMERKPEDISIKCSVFYDDSYWYIKYFINGNWAYEPMMEAAKITGMEDYHYQNQSDPPEDISYEEYESRIEVWDKLLGEEGNYRNGFVYDIFDAYEFRKLLERNYYKGFKTNEELYSHLAYKFDKNYSK